MARREQTIQKESNTRMAQNQTNWQGQSEKIHYLTEPEIARFLSCSKKDCMDAALFHLIYSCGLRAVEAHRLKVKDVQLGEKRILITRAKRKDEGRFSYHHLDEITWSLLRRWLKKRLRHRAVRLYQNEYLFLSQCSHREAISISNIQSRFKKYAALAGIEAYKQHVHVLRHTAGTQMARRGLNAEQIRSRLGHVSMISTDVYVRLQGKEKEQADRAAAEALKI